MYKNPSKCYLDDAQDTKELGDLVHGDRGIHARHEDRVLLDNHFRVVATAHAASALVATTYKYKTHGD